MKKKKLKLTSFTKQTMEEGLMRNIYAGSEVCGNTCDCTCSCDSGNSQQSNSNVSSASVSNRDTSVVSSFLDGLIGWKPIGHIQ